MGSKRFEPKASGDSAKVEELEAISKGERAKMVRVRK